MTSYCHIDSPLGPLTVAGEEDAVTGLWLEGQKYYASTLESGAQPHDLPIFDEVRRWLSLYFKGENPAPFPSLSPRGSAFRQAVWRMLREIPCGAVTTYGELSKKLAAQGGISSLSAQAVGGAVGHNPISILIPCHRVVGADGSLVGYAGGVEKKLFLLQLERVPMDRLFLPKRPQGG